MTDINIQLQPNDVAYNNNRLNDFFREQINKLPTVNNNGNVIDPNAPADHTEARAAEQRMQDIAQATLEHRVKDTPRTQQ
ncbi:hypothetical protein [Arthrobacter sp. NyZ413]|uniref:hypothetical protein n=1 Tax=Arthrobacter sp. NyZ413 TaxID=3144669 RepID=UPI003BF7A6DA